MSKKKPNWNVRMSDELFNACVDMASTVGRCDAFLNGVATEPGEPTLTQMIIRRAAKEFRAELSARWEAVRIEIEKAVNASSQAELDPLSN